MYSQQSDNLIDGEIYISYGAISNENVPDDILEQAKKISIDLNEKNFVLRASPDSPISNVCKEVAEKKEICVPWKGFAGEEGFCKTQNSAKAIACRFQPGLSKLKPAIHAIVGHYIHVILGKNLKSPIKFLLCWTEDGAELLNQRTSRTGRIGIAIAVASWINIPVFNLKNYNTLERYTRYINQYNQPFKEGEFHADMFKFKPTKEI